MYIITNCYKLAQQLAEEAAKNEYVERHGKSTRKDLFNKWHDHYWELINSNVIVVEEEKKLYSRKTVRRLTC